jgi:hypothetical protein
MTDPRKVVADPTRYSRAELHDALVQAVARTYELEDERDKARDFAIGCLSGDVWGWADENGDSGDGST